MTVETFVFLALVTGPLALVILHYVLLAIRLWQSTPIRDKRQDELEERYLEQEAGVPPREDYGTIVVRDSSGRFYER